MTLQTKYDIGQKVYYPTQKANKDGTLERVVRELTVSRIEAAAWVDVDDRIDTGASYATLEYSTPIEECFLLPTEEAAWEEHERRERADESIQGKVMLATDAPGN